MSAPVITGLRADIVPHRQWAISKWFYANRLWYYHRRGTDEEIVPNRRFYELIDPDLRELCRLLNESGLHTTPSCQGHNYPMDRFRRIWDELTREQEAVTGPGLEVRDAETDAVYLFREPGYQLPWADFDAFYAQAADHQGTGYIGIVVPPDRPAMRDRFETLETRSRTLTIAADPELGRLLGGSLFGLLVNEPDVAARSAIWRQLTDRVQCLLSDSCAAAVMSSGATSYAPACTDSDADGGHPCNPFGRAI